MRPVFSSEQRLAIETTGVNLLVSAAAGAGKTTVLVQRILHLLLRGDPPRGLDAMLVVTFTRAAAREMRDRLASALRSLLESDPDNGRIRRELALLDRASIGTLDSFCQEVVRQNFHVLGVNPGFLVLEPAEADLLWEEIVDGVFESHYADDSDRGAQFRRLVEAYGGRRDDRALAREIRRVADFLRITANPDAWRRRSRDAFGDFAGDDGRGRPLGNTLWGRGFYERLDERLASVVERLNGYIRRMTELAVPDPKRLDFAAALLESAQSCRRALKSDSPGDWRLSLPESQAMRLPQTRPRMDDNLKARAARLLDRLLKPARDDIKALVAFEARFSESDWAAGVAAAAPLLERLFLVTDEILDAFSDEKTRLGALDFADIERLALVALSAPESHEQPSPVALRYRDRFEHVLVDEFQDINELQAAILRLVAREHDARGRPPNFFAVGDVKQSIYGFRLAEPEIFVAVHQRSAPAQTPPSPSPANQRVDLPRNYRSRRSVLDTVNAAFRRLMDGALGGIPYDDTQALVEGRASDPSAPAAAAGRLADELPTEGILVDAAAPVVDSAGADAESAAAAAEGDTEEIEAATLEREAFALAARLRQLVGNEPDGSDAALWIVAPPLSPAGAAPVHRPVRWGDIVILVRAVTGSEPFVDALRQCGVPVAAPPTRGLLAALEIRDILTVLRLLDNPCQDIPLAAHLRSPMGAFSTNDLVTIRLGEREGDYFAAVAGQARSADTPLARRCAAVMERLDRWRRMAREVPVAELIDRILDETAYGAYASALPDGARRAANLDALRAEAARFDAFARRGLARFLRYLDRLEEAGRDTGAGAAEAPDGDVVRLMSIHKSKGLEFPVVVAANLGRAFNMQDLQHTVVADRRWLVGLRTPSGRTGETLPSLSHVVVAEERKRAMLAEEMRLLYVAMTRARDHLILSGCVARPDDKIDAWEFWADADGVLPLWLRLGARTPLGWLGPALAGSLSWNRVSRVTLPQTAAAEASDEPECSVPDWEIQARDALAGIAGVRPPAIPPGLRAKLSVTEIKRLWEYAHEPEDGAAGSLTPPVIPRLAEGDPYALAAEPASAARSSPLRRGTLMHLALCHLDPARCDSRESVSAQLDDLVGRALIPPESRDVIDTDAIVWLFDEPLGKRLREQANAVRREIPFTAFIPVSAAYPRLTPEAVEVLKDERVIVQGVADLVLVEPGGLTVIDYKTDAVAAGPALDERAAGYAMQLRLYARALSEIFGVPAREAHLVFLAARVIHPVPLG